MKAGRILFPALGALLLLAAGLLIPLRKPNGLEGLEGFEAGVGRQVLSAARDACLDAPLADWWMLRLRLDSLWLKDVFVLGGPAGPGPDQDFSVPNRREDYRYHYQAGIRAYAWFGIPAGRYILSGNRDGDAVSCASVN